MKSTERSFLPAALEISETLPSPTGRLLTYLICLMTILSLIWSYFGEIDIIAVAPGKLVPLGKTQIIQSPDSGVVRSIDVKMGDTVRKGQRLVQLDVTSLDAEIARSSAELSRARLDRIRLEAFLAGKDDFELDDESEFTEAQLAQAKTQLLADTASRVAKLSSLDHEINEKIAELNAAEVEYNRATDVLPKSALIFGKKALRQPMDRNC
jgi:hemolysin D